MDLQKLKNLCAESMEIRNQSKKLDLSVKEEKRKIKKQIDDLKNALEEQLNEVEKKALEQSDKLSKQSAIIFDELGPLLMEARKYGRYDILDLGEILKDLATKITEKKFDFIIRESKGFLNLEGYAVYYNNQEASLFGDEPYCEEFVFAESKTPEKDSIPLCANGDGVIDWGGGTYFGKSDSVMLYRIDGQFEFDVNDEKLKEMKIYPFVYDFLNYVSLYRLNNDLSEIDKTKLKLLEEKFLIEFGDKYEEYKKYEEIKCESIEDHEHIMSILAAPQKRKKMF